MLLLASYDIVFQEVPGEVTLALNLSNCPNRCPGCHSPHLQQAVGEPLDEALLKSLLDRYATTVSCIAFMGGDGNPGELNNLTDFVRRYGGLKTAWYSGKCEISPEVEVKKFNFLKIGPFSEQHGGLDSATTNQRFYEVGKDGTLTDKTGLFRKKSLSS
jgi:anaerobic ribonucleoside-triphosphate reductase activating protein